MCQDNHGRWPHLVAQHPCAFRPAPASIVDDAVGPDSPKIVRKARKACWRTHGPLILFAREFGYLQLTTSSNVWIVPDQRQMK